MTRMIVRLAVGDSSLCLRTTYRFGLRLRGMVRLAIVVFPISNGCAQSWHTHSVEAARLCKAPHKNRHIRVADSGKPGSATAIPVSMRHAETTEIILTYLAETRLVWSWMIHAPCLGEGLPGDLRQRHSSGTALTACVRPVILSACVLSAVFLQRYFLHNIERKPVAAGYGSLAGD